mgnify:CR=1 FL=1
MCGIDSGMNLIRGIKDLPAARGCALTIGNYDGVHLGHRAMIEILRHRARTMGCASAVLAFEPSSKEFLDPDGAPPRLTRWREKFAHLAALGVDRFITLRFDEHMRSMTPEAFVRELLVEGLQVRHLVVGPDFRYGRQAAGTVQTLRAAGERFGFQVEQTEHVAHLERLVYQLPAAAADHAVLGIEDGIAVFGLDRQGAAGAVRHLHQFQQAGVAQVRIRQAGNVRDPDAGFVEGVEFGTGAIRRQASGERHPVHGGDGRGAGKLEQGGGKVDRAHHLVHRAARRAARIADQQRDARAEIADRGIALPPGIVLEKLHAVVGVDDDDRVAG